MNLELKLCNLKIKVGTDGSGPLPGMLKLMNEITKVHDLESFGIPFPATVSFFIDEILTYRSFLKWA